MAYAAVISLKLTIHRFLNSPHTSILSPSREILDVAYKQLTSLQEALKRSDDRDISSRRKKFNALDTQIRESVHQLQDSLESHASNQFLSSHGEENISSPLLPLQLDLLSEVWQEIISFAEAAKKMEKDYIQILENPSNEGEDDDDGSSLAALIPSRTIDSGVKMVGLSDSIADFKEHVLRIIRPDDFGVFSVFGGAGNGRSIVAKRIYDDIYVNKERSFDCGAWVRIGSTYQLKEILQTIIAQINQGGHELLALEGEEKLQEYLYESLKGRRYVVALDDVCDTEILSQLRRSLPEQNNGSMVLITTGLIEVAQFEESFFVYEIPVIWDELLSWSYMRLVIMSAGWLISPEFEEAGKKIAKNCRGFRVVFVKVMVALLRSEKKLEFWKKLAEEEDDPIFMVDDEILEASQIQRSLRVDDGIWANDLFDFSITINVIKKNLYPERFFPKMGIMTVYGMAGVGKTILVRNIFEDFSILHRFDHRVWVNIGPKYQSEDILVDILAQTYPDIDKRNMKKDAKLVEDLCTQLSNKKCLVVLDDLWSQEPVHYLKRLIPNIKGELVFTTRLRKLVFPGDRAYKLRFLNKEESWDLLREKVFGEERCPRQLEKAGRKIAESCDGLPLVILAVADKLRGSEKTLEYWNKVAEKKVPAVMEAQYEISTGLLPIYESLPQHLKACFLYMGVFPQNYEIPISTLIKLWFAEGFLEPNPSQTVEEFATQCLMELVERTVVMVKKGSDLNSNKSCSLHSVYWHISCNAATKNNFFHALDTCIDISMENIERQRRLCIRKGILLGIKDVLNAMESVTTSRALLCTGPPHQYPVPLSFGGSRLVKVLEALAIRLYEFPVEVVKQLHLRYLALTCDGELPPSISKLWSLQFLIVRQCLSIKNSQNPSYLPKEIWDMKELKHLQVSGSLLPYPDCGALLPNLSSLFDVSVQSCTKRVFKRLPNVKNLGIQIELEPNDKSNPFHCLNGVSRLQKLESLKCVVVNPDFGLAPPAPRSMFPSSLKKLCLSGLGYPWEHMHIIGELPNLEVLKLRCYAFQGSFWKIDSGEFPKLKFLSIEDTDLERWDFEMPCIYHLKHLSIKHCYNLEQFPFSLPPLLEMFEVIDSHPLALSWAEQMKEDNWERRRMKSLEVHLQSSWTDDN